MNVMLIDTVTVWLVGMLMIMLIVMMGAMATIILWYERAAWVSCDGGVADWTDEPKVSLLYYCRGVAETVDNDEWALANEYENNNVVDDDNKH